MVRYSKDLINTTVQYFANYYKEFDETDAQEVLNNFLGFANLLQKLEYKRNNNKEKKQ